MISNRDICDSMVYPFYCSAKLNSRPSDPFRHSTLAFQTPTVWSQASLKATKAMKATKAKTAMKASKAKTAMKNMKAKTAMKNMKATKAKTAMKSMKAMKVMKTMKAMKARKPAAQVTPKAMKKPAVTAAKAKAPPWARGLMPHYLPPSEELMYEITLMQDGQPVSGMSCPASASLAQMVRRAQAPTCDRRAMLAPSIAVHMTVGPKLPDSSEDDIDHESG